MSFVLDAVLSALPTLAFDDAAADIPGLDVLAW
jgi:hypothetical protein